MITSQPRRDLFRRPPFQQQLEDVRPQPRPFLEPPEFRPPRPIVGLALRPIRPIVVAAAVVADLPPDRRTRTPHPIGDLLIGLATVDADPDLFTCGEGQRTRPRFAIA